MSIIAHDLFIMFMNLSDSAFLNIEGSDYPCVISLISEIETINLLQNADLTEKNNTSLVTCIMIIKLSHYV